MRNTKKMEVEVSKRKQRGGELKTRGKMKYFRQIAKKKKLQSFSISNKDWIEHTSSHHILKSN